MNNTFEINGKTYKTDERTIEVLRTVVDGYRKSGDASAVIAVMELGKLTGCIVEVK